MHQCNTCPETDPSKFYAKSKKRCKKCTIAVSLSRYHALDDEGKTAYKAYQKNWQKNNMMQYRFLEARSRAAKKGIPCDITSEWLEDQFLEQDGKCFYSGITMKLDKKHYSISVDRINSSKGYTKDNVVLVCHIVNSMKNELSLTEFAHIVSKLHEGLNG